MGVATIFLWDRHDVMDVPVLHPTVLPIAAVFLSPIRWYMKKMTATTGMAYTG